MDVAVVVGAVVLLGVMVAVLARQGSVGRLSEEQGRPDPQRDVVERPAGPGVEPMRADEPGRPVTPPPDPGERAW
jgi:hypothetical protein